MNARLDEIEARAAAATEGPWYWEPPSVDSFPQSDESLMSSGKKSSGGYDEAVLVGWGYDASGTEASDEDRDFIAAARTDVPALVAALRAVLDLHRPITVYGLADDCECSEDDVDWDDRHYEADNSGDLLCDKSPTGDRWCSGCAHDEDGDGRAWPCPTVRAITAALDAS